MKHLTFASSRKVLRSKHCRCSQAEPLQGTFMRVCCTGQLYGSGNAVKHRICTYVYACVRMYMNVYMHSCMYACMHVCMYVCMYVCICSSMHLCSYTPSNIHVQMYLCTYKHTNGTHIQMVRMGIKRHLINRIPGCMLKRVSVYVNVWDIESESHRFVLVCLRQFLITGTQGWHLITSTYFYSNTYTCTLHMQTTKSLDLQQRDCKPRVIVLAHENLIQKQDTLILLVHARCLDFSHKL
jgi:hypothetical protein